MDGVLRSTSENRDLQTSDDFYDRLEATWLVSFHGDNSAQWRLQNWRSQSLVWRLKSEMKVLERRNRFQRVERILAKIFRQDLPIDQNAKQAELLFRSNHAMSYGPVDLACRLIERLAEAPFYLFEQPFTDWRMSYKNARVAFEVCVERTAFKLSLTYLAAMQQYPQHLNLLPQGQHQLTDYQTLVHVARVYIYQGCWRKALDLLRCCCLLVSEQRKGIANEQQRSDQYGSSDAEKAFDWSVWVCLWHHSMSSATDLVQEMGVLDPKFTSWSAEALYHSESGKARRIGDALRRSRVLQDGNEGLKVLSSKYHEELQDKDIMASVSQWLDQDTLIVHYTLIHEGLGIICLDRSGLHSAQWRLGLPGFGAWDVQRLTSLIFTQVENPNLARLLRENSASGERLSNVLLELSKNLILPIQDVLSQTSHKRLCIVPAGALDRVPFAALTISGVPLCETFNVYQVPSLAVLKELSIAAHARSKEVQRVTIIGKSYHDPQTVPEIALECSAALHKLLDRGRLLSGLDLTNQDFLQTCQTEDIIHVATHGESIYEQPLQSYIELRERFHVADMVKIRSRAKLIFMSACFTALGALTKSDDMTGFQATILEAGALSFAGSLWNASALSSVFFVYFFYEELMQSSEGSEVLLIDAFGRAQRRLRSLRRSGMQAIVDELQVVLSDYSEAAAIPVDILRDSSIFYLRNDRLEDHFNSPFFWAPFIFVGYS